MPGQAKKWVKRLTLPVLLLSAGCTTVSADIPPPRQCSRYVKPFLEATPHAAPPASAASKDWVGFGIAEAGQTELANRDKRLAGEVLTVCETETLEAHTRAATRAKPWYKRIF